MTTLEMHDSQQRLTDVVRLAQQESEVILLDGQQPVARVLPIPPQAAAEIPARTLGLHDGDCVTDDQFDAPLPEEFWTGQP